MSKKYGKQLTLDEIKQYAFKGLIHLKKICEENNIQYFLAFGTLLGAVRHQGFIPWDDDIDILVPRYDYKRLLDVLNEDRSKDWKIYCSEYMDWYYFPWAKYCNTKTVITPSRFVNGKLYGVSIDIFPLDGIDAESISGVRTTIENYLNQYRKEVRKKQVYRIIFPGLKNQIMNKLKCLYYNCIGKRSQSMHELNDTIPDESFILDPRDSRYLAFLFDIASSTWEHDYFFGTNKNNKVMFEGESFNAPSNPDAVLTATYGDYMKLPPVEKRRPTHYSTIYEL